MTKTLFLSIGECMIEMSGTAQAGYRLGFAGDTLNTAWYARACLPDSWEVAYFTRLGRDPYSAQMRDFQDDNGIGTRFITEDPVRQPGLYLIEVTNGERRFSYWRDTAAARGLADDPDALRAALAQARVAYLSGVTLAILPVAARETLLAALAGARAAGVLTVFDPNIRLRLWPDADALRHWTMRAAAVCDIALPSFEDEAEMFGDASLADCAARYRAAGCGLVVVKNGGGAMLARVEDTTTVFDGFARLTPVDTTGAGDSFNGGFLAAHLQGAPLADAVARAHALSCQVIAQYGALVAMDRLHERS